MATASRNPHLEDDLEDRAVIFKPQEGEVIKIKGTTLDTSNMLPGKQDSRP
jgi:hypothetical protein